MIEQLMRDGRESRPGCNLKLEEWIIMKKISRRSFVKAAGTAAVLGVLTACGGSSSSTAASTASSAAASGSTAAASEALSADVQAIVDRGVLKVGVKNAVKGFRCRCRTC